MRVNTLFLSNRYLIYNASSMQTTRWVIYDFLHKTQVVSLHREILYTLYTSHKSNLCWYGENQLFIFTSENPFLWNIEEDIKYDVKFEVLLKLSQFIKNFN